MILFLQQVNIEGPGLLGIFLKKQKAKLKIVSMENNQGLPPLSEYRGIIVLGGPMNVYEVEKYPFLLKEEAYLKQALKRKIPVIGICLGAQLLAKASGAEVKKAEKEEIGWYNIGLESEAEDDSLFKGLDKELRVFQWHQDTFELPEGGVLLARGESCKNQAFRIGNSAWGLQFHPEMNKSQITAWLECYKSKAEKEKIIYSYFYSQDKYLEQAEKICNNFLNIVDKYRAEKKITVENG